MAYNTVSDRLREVYNAARRVDCLSQVKQSFRQEYLELVVQANVSKTTVELLEILQTSMRCRTRLREMEKKMNVNTFVKRLTAGHWEISGTDKDSNPILWVRVGFANAGRGGIGSRRNINFKTQDWYSAVRSTMFMYELYNRQRLLMEEIPSTAVHCFDFRGQGFLDGNLKFERTILNLIGKLFPVVAGEKFYVFGLSSALSSIFNAANKFSGRKDKYVFMSRPEQALEFVKDKSDIPAWLLDFKDHAEGTCVDPNDIWGIDKIIDPNGANCLSHEDMFNPSAADVNHYRPPQSILVGDKTRTKNMYRGSSFAGFRFHPRNHASGSERPSRQKVTLETIYSLASSESRHSTNSRHSTGPLSG